MDGAAASCLLNAEAGGSQRREVFTMDTPLQKQTRGGATQKGTRRVHRRLQPRQGKQAVVFSVLFCSARFFFFLN